MKFRWVILPLVVCVVAGLLLSQRGTREQPGPLPGGGVLLNSGWKITPAGQQLEVGTFPMASALSRDGRTLFVLNGGVAPPSISVVDIAAKKETSRLPLPDAWLGITLNEKGDKVYAGGGSQSAVYELNFANGALARGRTFNVADPSKRTHEDFIGDVALSPDGRLLYAADLFHDSVVVINPLTGFIVDHFKTGRRPYRILFRPDGKSFFVSSWADGSVMQYQTGDGSSLGGIRLGPHPTDMIWRKTDRGYTMYVAVANTNAVYSMLVGASGDLARGETINVSLTPRQPLGMTPTSLALSPDARTLYVVCSDGNTVAQVDLSQDRTQVAGFIPTGWYPTAVRALTDGSIVVLNGRGGRSYPNPKGPNPTRTIARPYEANPADYQYVGLIQKGSVSFISLPDAAQLQKYNDAVLKNSAYQDNKLDIASTLPAGIKHVIFVVKENRTFDQVLGDMKEGNGDPSLVLFGENVTPNLHKLAREFVLLDNFYVSADVSADGHNWSTAAIASDYVQKMWPNSYGGRRKHYDYEGGEPAALPPAGYLWTNAGMAGITMRNYGYFATNLKVPESDGTQIHDVRDSVLAPVTDMQYRAFDLDYPDIERIKEFKKELAEYEGLGTFPQLVFMRLGNDHTSGQASGKIAPLSAAADNDAAVGMLVEAVSKSKFWKETAIFIIEDDAQNGPDHVDSHRSPAFVISPFVKRHSVDSTMYNTVSILRTMEMILGLHPMTQFDAAARPMNTVFQANPDTTPFQAEAPRTPLDARNPGKAKPPEEAELDLDDADRNDDAVMNAMLWHAIRGTDAPPPVRSFFSR